MRRNIHDVNVEALNFLTSCCIDAISQRIKQHEDTTNCLIPHNSTASNYITHIKRLDEPVHLSIHGNAYKTCTSVEIVHRGSERIRETGDVKYPAAT